MATGAGAGAAAGTGALGLPDSLRVASFTLGLEHAPSKPASTSVAAEALAPRQLVDLGAAAKAMSLFLEAEVWGMGVSGEWDAV